MFDYFYYLRYFFYLFSHLNNRHYLLYNTINYLVFDLHMILDLPSCAIFYSIHNFLNYFLYLYHCRDFNYLLHNFLHIDWHFNYFLYYLFDSHNLLTCNLNLFEFCLYVIHNFLHLYWNFYLDYFLSENFNLHHLRYYLLNFYQFLDYSWDLYYCFHLIFIGN